MKIAARTLGKIGEYFSARIDRYLHALIVVDAFHAMIHQGRAYSFSDYDSDVDIAGPKHYRITAPLERLGETHFEFVVNASGPCTITFGEAPTSSGIGTALTAYNRKRESSNVPFTKIRKDSTVSAAGTIVETVRLGIAGNPAKSSGGSLSGRHEWELRPATIYEMTITPDADNTQVWVNFDFYEVIPNEL